MNAMNVSMINASNLFALLCLLLVAIIPVSAAADNYSVSAHLAPESLLLGGARAGHQLIVVGERGHVLRSDDHGQNWQQIIVPTRATLTAVAFVDELVGLAVGHDLTILRTADGGSSWQLMHEDRDEQPPFLDVLFVDKNIVFAIGAYGTFFESTDGGRNWEQRWISEDDFHLNAIAATETGIYIAAEAGMAYKSSDQGETFDELYPDYEGSFFGLLASAENCLLLFGLRGNLFHSDDGGATWNQLDTGTDASLTTAIRLADNRILIAGLSGTLLTVDLADMRVTPRNDPDRRGFSQLLPTAAGKIVAIGDFGVTLLSENLFR